MAFLSSVRPMSELKRMMTRTVPVRVSGAAARKNKALKIIISLSQKLALKTVISLSNHNVILPQEAMAEGKKIVED